MLAIGGFHESRPLEPAATFAAGKSIRVYCNSVGHPLGYVAYPGDRRIEVSARQVCAPLLAWRARRPVGVYEFAFGLMVLAHEAQHARGTWDETDATCDAIALLPVLARRYFPLRGRATAREIVDDARAAQLSLGEQYNAHPC